MARARPLFQARCSPSYHGAAAEVGKEFEVAVLPTGFAATPEGSGHPEALRAYRSLPYAGANAD
jgi:hypothetical protein